MLKVNKGQLRLQVCTATPVRRCNHKPVKPSPARRPLLVTSHTSYKHWDWPSTGDSRRYHTALPPLLLSWLTGGQASFFYCFLQTIHTTQQILFQMSPPYTEVSQMDHKITNGKNESLEGTVVTYSHCDFRRNSDQLLFIYGNFQ